MLSIRTFSSLAFATLCLITGPAASRAADTTVSPLTLSVSRAVGADAVVLNGTSRASGPLEATLYATFSRDLPTVVLSRQNLAVGADGTSARRFLPLRPSSAMRSSRSSSDRSTTMSPPRRTSRWPRPTSTPGGRQPSLTRALLRSSQCLLHFDPFSPTKPDKASPNTASSSV